MRGINGSSSTRSVRARLSAPESVPFPGAHLGLRWGALEETTAAEIVEFSERSLRTPSRFNAEQYWSLRIQRFRILPELTRFLIGRDSDGVMQAFAHVAVNPSYVNVIFANVTGAVATTWQGKGIGRAILEWQDGVARQIVAGLDVDLPVAICSEVRSDDVEHRRLLTAGGFSPLYEIRTLRAPELREADVAEAKERLDALGTSIRPLEPGDLPAIRHLRNRIMLRMSNLAQLSETDWELTAARYSAEDSVVLVQDGDIVGYSLIRRAADAPVIADLGVETVMFPRVLTDLIVAHVDQLAKVDNRVDVRLADFAEFASLLEERGFEYVSSKIMYSIDL